MKHFVHHILIAFAALATLGSIQAQEVLAPLSSANRPSPRKSTDTLTLELPFFDDFSNYEGLPSPARWLTYDAFVNKDYAPEPPTIGIVTLDALNQQGDLYPNASTNIFSADTLTSQRIRLDSITGIYNRKLQPSDSVCLSFFYLPGGWYGNMWERVGNTPSQQDSLFLECYAAADSQWHIVWATGGFDADTAGRSSRWPWRFACIAIDDPIFFNKQFQFRFRNYASLDPNPKSGISGNCDQWNIDYIFLNYNRHHADSLFRDVAFVERAPSMLKNYRAMPAKQFVPSDMADQVAVRIVNRYNQTLASNYSYTVYDENDNIIGNYNGGYENIPAFFPNGSYQQMAVHSNPPVNFVYPVAGAPVEFRVVHVVREGVGGDNHICNDTMELRQTFSNYYAYDDGVPENGYGLTATGSRLWFAQRYALNTEDTLTAVDLYFNRTRNNENANIQFQLCIWKSRNGKPGELIYKDDTRLHPEFDGMNRYHRYPLGNPQTLNDTIFVGIEQLSTDFINLGFDRSNDARQQTYYRTGNEWMQSILSGAVMMRPVFGSHALVGIENPPSFALEFSCSPNPTHGQLHIRWDNGTTDQLIITIFDMQGRRRMHLPFSPSIDLSALPNGVYLLCIEDVASRQQARHKIIVSH